MTEKYHGGLKRALLLLTAAVLLTLLVLTPLNIVSLSEHECLCTCGGALVMHCTCGGCCSVCAAISYMSSLVKAAMAVLAFVMLAHITAARLRVACEAAAEAQNDSPVGLKVKLSN